MKYCAQCGAQLVDEAVVCPQCGCPVQPQRSVDPNASPKSRLIALLLCVFVGGLGIHRFYVGKIGTGVLWLLTAGCFGIGALVDLIMMACGHAMAQPEPPPTTTTLCISSNSAGLPSGPTTSAT